MFHKLHYITQKLSKFILKILIFTTFLEFMKLLSRDIIRASIDSSSIQKVGTSFSATSYVQCKRSTSTSVVRQRTIQTWISKFYLQHVPQRKHNTQMSDWLYATFNQHLKSYILKLNFKYYSSSLYKPFNIVQFCLSQACIRSILVLKFIFVFIIILHSFLSLHPVSRSSDDEDRAITTKRQILFQGFD